MITRQDRIDEIKDELIKLGTSPELRELRGQSLGVR